MCVVSFLFYGLCAILIALALLQIYYWHIMCPIYKEAPNKRLEGQTAVVTGGNTGMGFETSKDLFQRGARVIMLCHDQRKGEVAVKELKQEFWGVKNVGQVSAKHLDLASLKNIRVCAKELAEDEKRIDLLVLNAGTAHTKTVRSINMINM
jgi:NAD(P)-dependent dehydrogenase (short-subunit alcohol dehydrogenase family)